MVKRRRIVRTVLVVLVACLCASTAAEIPAGSKVTVALEERPLAEVVQALAKQSGNAPLAVPDDLRNLPVTLKVADVDYWQALDRLCASAGLIYVPDLEHGGLRLDKALEHEGHGAYVGCMVVKAEEVRRIADYRVIREPRPGMTSADTRCVVRYFWEDRLPVVRARAEVIEVRDAEGRPIRKTQIPQPRPYRVHVEHGSRPPSGTMTFYMTGIPEDADRLSEVSGVVALWWGEGRKELVLDLVPGDAEATASFGELTLTLRKSEPVADGVRIDVRAGLGGAGAELLLGAYGSPYGFYLAGPDGKRTACTVRQVTRNLHLQGDAGHRYTPAHRPTGHVDVVLSCAMPGPMGKGWSLVYVCPERIEKAELAFAIRNLPLR